MCGGVYVCERVSVRVCVFGFSTPRVRANPTAAINQLAGVLERCLSPTLVCAWNCC